MKPFLDIAIHIAKGWIIIGMLVWIFLSRIGVIENAFAKRLLATDRLPSRWFAFKASVVTILVWPVFVAVAVKNRKSMAKALKEAVWR